MTRPKSFAARVRSARWWAEGYGGLPRWVTAVVLLVFVVSAPFLARGLVAQQNGPTPHAVSAPRVSAPEVTRAPAASALSLADLRADGTLSVHFVGDSLTAGWNASRKSRSFRPLVVRALARGGLVNATADFRSGGTVETVSRVVKPMKADVTVIELGTNDVDRTDVTTFTAAYEKLLTTVGDSGKVVCVGPWSAGLVGGLNAVIAKSCAAYGGAFVDVGDLRANAKYVAAAGTAAFPAAADGAHPNDAGHAAIARRILAALRD